MSFLSRFSLIAGERRLFRIILFFAFFLRWVTGWFVKSNKCVKCNKSSGIYVLCDSCLVSFMNYDSLLKSNIKRCSSCGRKLISEIELCSRCREEKIVASADGVFSVYSYALWKKDLLYAWKMEDARILSPVFASLVHKCLKEIETIAGCSLSVVPVPPRPGKIRKTGWDQIDELCWYLEKMYGTRIAKMLVRYSKEQQKTLDRFQRKRLIDVGYGQVSVKRLAKLKKIPESVLLVDDVLTTGSTAEACSQILKKMGVKRVFVLTLFSVS